MKPVTFASHEINLSVAPLLSGPVVPVQHAPEGWQQIQRKWRTSFTEWEGAPSWELQIPFVFNQMGWNPRTQTRMASVEKQIRMLERLAEKLPNKPRTPIFTVDANGAIPHDHTNDHTKNWIVSTIAWGDYTINKGLDRVRQEGTVTVWEYLPDQIIQNKERLPARPVPKRYLIKKGDTLQKIAVYFYGDQTVWRDIAKLNKVHNPLHLTKGKWLKMPTVKMK